MTYFAESVILIRKHEKKESAHMYIKEMSNALEEYHSFMETQANRTVFQTPEWGEVKADGS